MSLVILYKIVCKQVYRTKVQRDTFRVWRAIILLMHVKCFGPAWVKASMTSKQDPRAVYMIIILI